MGAIQLGSLTLQIDLFILLAALVLAGAVMLLRLRLEGMKLRSYTDWMLTILLVVILNEKFGYLWDAPSILWQQPKALLFLQGTSWNGNVLMIIGLVVWTVHYARKHQIRLQVLADLLAHGILFALAVYGFIYAYAGMIPDGYTPLPVPSTLAAALPPVESIWSVLLLAGLWLRRSALGTGADARLTLLVSGVLGMLISFISVPTETMLGLATKQWVLIGLLMLGYWMMKIEEQRAEEDKSAAGST
ncbi:hypothetical protein [Paenibacillus agilis]|uniref:Diacylglyceryl transferase n=1 Tax=Paenibacillus agilis TaxID=3020863 RepID=A0A559IKU6_9BACL|nr:hypothetical protein [Paenibacillus agilis]TVX88288.1 hypothetical protein FPZ44_20565 [Paenibacillus agilis]